MPLPLLDFSPPFSCGSVDSGSSCRGSAKLTFPPFRSVLSLEGDVPRLASGDSADVGDSTVVVPLDFPGERSDEDWCSPLRKL